ncbi:MAG: hypothetical protein ACYTGO_14290 [Planctomycetota bacterium]|jgi:hypothetical protein
MKTAILTILSLAMLPLTSSVEPPTVGFDVLASFGYEEGMKLPEEVTKHHKKKVTVTGFMATEDGSEGDVESEGETVKIKPGTAEVTGTLYVEEVKEDDVVVALYCMDVESVK